MNTFALSLKGNSKTACPTTTSNKESCPDTCPLKESGCYAKYSFLGGYWTKLSKGLVKNSYDYTGLLKAIKGLQDGMLWQHNQAGDLLHNNGDIDSQALKGLVKANKGKRGFTYTHHVLNDHNVNEIGKANELGFTVNISANNEREAEEAYNLEFAPVTVLLPIDADKVSYTVKDKIKIVACPITKQNKITCAQCKLCAIPDRDYIIGFRAHGTAKKES